ncbi:hypothetical protein IMSHALPRED_000005 [Imshaugia aleurites]|uniref:Uncharacterized protein n=1 Tax=Imshaugia aleurites TaxID=172621 RepID=A0A8H3EC73_9LECA|nr:hypothetical protein IMSHALPRED_000005 [Imshaugia aleurites]
MAAQIAKLPSRAPCEQALSRVVFNSGTPYQVAQFELDRLTNLRGLHNGGFVSGVQATFEVRYHNNIQRMPTPTEHIAIARVQAAMSIQDWHPDVIIKAFDDLDTIFLDGRLHGNVNLCWSDHRINYRYVPGSSRDLRNYNDVHAQTVSSQRQGLDALAASQHQEVEVKARGLTYTDIFPPGQCQIFLNAEYILGEGVPGIPSPWEWMWTTLMHEMCHA